MPLKDWSTTDASNDDADSASSIDWTENQAPSTVNNSARAMMTQIRNWFDGIAGGTFIVSAANVAGTADVITLTVTQAQSYTAGQRFTFIAEGDNTTSVTVNVNTQGAKALNHRATALAAGTIKTGDVVLIEYDGTDFELLSAVNKATVAETRAASTGGHAVTTDLLQTAAAAVALTDAATVAVDWTAGVYFTLTLTASRVLGNPTNEIPGQFRTILVAGDGATPWTLTFGSEYGGTTPTLADITSTKKYLLTVFCKSAGQFLVTAVDGSDA